MLEEIAEFLPLILKTTPVSLEIVGEKRNPIACSIETRVGTDQVLDVLHALVYLFELSDNLRSKTLNERMLF